MKRLRYTAGLTRYQIAEVIGVSYGTIAEYENAKCSITEKKADQLAKLFNVDKDIFL